MHPSTTLKRAALAGAGVALLVVILSLAFAQPAQTAPRAGITVARGVAAEARVSPGGATFSTQTVGAASIAAPLTRSEDYGVMPWAAAWAVGAVGAVVLIGGARAFSLAQRRGRGGRVAGLAAIGPAAGDTARHDERRKAA